MKPVIIQNGKLVHIKRSEGMYSILYGVHIKAQDPLDIPLDTDAIVLETGTAKYLADPEKILNELKEHVQYKDVVALAEIRQIPILFVDVKYRFNDHMLLLADNALAAVEWTKGMELLRDRKKGGVGKMLLASWLLLPFVANTSRLISMFTNKGYTQTSLLKRLSHTLHPEIDLLYLTMRNAVIAEKEIAILKNMKYKHIVTILGAGHVGIEDMLVMDDEKRLKNIESLLPLLKRVAMHEYIYKSVQYRYNGRKWEVERIVESQQLKDLVF